MIHLHVVVSPMFVYLHKQNIKEKRPYSIKKYTKVFTSIVLELGDRAPDEDALVFSYLDGLKEDI